MRIGVITYYKVMNFGATLQAVSTYCCLKKAGHEPVFINYLSKEAQQAITKGANVPQWNIQLDFVNSIIKDQTEVCESAEDIIKQVKKFDIKGIVIGSDALLQHHSLFARIRKGVRKPFYIQKISSDRLFPNVFWGCGLNDNIPVALLSVSSQNSDYNLFPPFTKWRMRKSLLKMRYISVRDSWTQTMVEKICGLSVPITPDPVFGFNQNASHLIPSKEEIVKKFRLSGNYVLLSLFGQAISRNTISELRNLFNREGKQFVILPMPTGRSYEYDADYAINFPLSPIDWYALIKYSSAYIGSNMHPIVVSLHNSVPCFSLDIWGRTNFFNKKIDDESSKVKHIMNVFGVGHNHRMIDGEICQVTAKEIYEGIRMFPVNSVKVKSKLYLDEYNHMMTKLINSLL